MLLRRHKEQAKPVVEVKVALEPPKPTEEKPREKSSRKK